MSFQFKKKKKQFVKYRFSGFKIMGKKAPRPSDVAKPIEEPEEDAEEDTEN